MRDRVQAALARGEASAAQTRADAARDPAQQVLDSGAVTAQTARLRSTMPRSRIPSR